MKHGTAALLAGVAFLHSSGAFAQSEGSNETSTPEPARVAAQAPSPSGIADIVVTATRRSENIQKVPIAISAFSEDTLIKSRIEGVADLGQITPSLSSASAGVGQTPYLRGVGSSDATPGQETAIAIYIDGVYQPTIWTNSIPFNNVERVEVLKGPQGTLFGRNATGGLIHIVTRDPEQELGGDLSVSYGNYDTWTGKAYVTGGITNDVAADLAVYATNQGKGWGTNLGTGNPTFKNRDLALRSKWKAEIGDRTTFTLIGDYRHQRTGNGYTQRLIPGSIAADGSVTVPGYYDVKSNFDFRLVSKVWSVSGKLEHEFNGFNVSLLSSYQDSNVDVDFDNDSTLSYTVHVSTRSAVNRTLQEELQISSNPGSPIKWIAGLYFMDMTGGFGGQKGIQLYGDGVVPGGLGVDIRNVIKTQSYAAFGEVVVPLASNTRLTAGLRYTRDNRRLVGRTQLDATPTGYSPIATIGTVDTKTHFSNPSYRLILDHDLTSNALLYASYSRGFKSGNYNALNPANPPFKPEKLIAYEVGMKGRFLGNSLQLNAAAFYYDYSNMQLVENKGNISNTVNAASSTIKGFEFDMTAVPTTNLQFRAGFSYLDAKYKDFQNASCFFPKPGGGNFAVSCDASGLPIVRTPKYSINVSGSYTIPTQVGEFRLDANYYFNSGVYFSPESRLMQPSYDLANATLAWTDLSDRFTISLYGRNLFDRQYTNYMIATELYDGQVAAPPRTYGVELRTKF